MKRNLGLASWLFAGSTTLCLTLACLASTAQAQQIPSRYANKQVRVPSATTIATPSAPAATRSSEVRVAAHGEPTPAVRTAGGISGRNQGASVRPVAARVFRSQQEADAFLAQEERALQGRSVVIQEHESLPLVDDDMTHVEGAIHSHGHDGGCGPNCGDSCGGSCGLTCRQACATICLPCIPHISLDKFEFFGGAQGFTGPATRGAGSSFGFHEGLNWGSSLPCMPNEPFAAQLGFRATQNNFSGSSITDDDRRQFFVTGGFFRRVDWGLQGGVVFDYMHDEWYYDAIDLNQIRGEVSWVFPCQHELGFWFTQGMSNTTTTSEFRTAPAVFTTVTEGWEPTDIYAAFYRRKFQDCGAEGRLFGGFTGESDGIIGADVNLPISDRFALRSGFTYLIPSEGQSTGGFAEESWNVGISLVWYPGCRNSRNQDYNRPLFNVADNGSFMIDRN